MYCPISPLIFTYVYIHVTDFVVVLSFAQIFCAKPFRDRLKRYRFDRTSKIGVENDFKEAFSIFFSNFGSFLLASYKFLILHIPSMYSQPVYLPYGIKA